MNTDGSISDVLRNTIYAISQRFVFDVKDLFLRILKDSAQHLMCLKFFAPWIQHVIDHSMKTTYLAKDAHKSFIPPVRDTIQALEDFSLGKACDSGPSNYHKKFDGPCLPQRDTFLSTIQPPSQLEISLRTQQLLLQHIAEDRHEKELLTSQLNAINNRTRLVHLITDENKKRLWKLLRKFFSTKQLNNANLSELYDYLDKGFTAEDLQDCSFSLPPREPLTDTLRLKLRRMLDESEATSPPEKPAAVKSMKQVLPSDSIHIPSTTAPPQVQVTRGDSQANAQAPEENVVPESSDDDDTSDSSAGDATD
jgi:hypothetical protein